MVASQLPGILGGLFDTENKVEILTFILKEGDPQVDGFPVAFPRGGRIYVLYATRPSCCRVDYSTGTKKLLSCGDTLTLALDARTSVRFQYIAGAVVYLTIVRYL